VPERLVPVALVVDFRGDPHALASVGVRLRPPAVERAEVDRYV
jgi:hypothetical protein